MKSPVQILRDALEAAKIGLRDWEVPANRYKALDGINEALALTAGAEADTIAGSIGGDEGFQMLLANYYLSDQDTEAMAIEREIFALIDAHTRAAVAAAQRTASDAGGAVPAELRKAFITLESSGGEGRNIVLKFNQRGDAYAVHEFLIKTHPAPTAEKASEKSAQVVNGHQGGRNSHQVEQNIHQAAPELDAFLRWAGDHLGQGYPLTIEDGSFVHSVTRWAFVAYKAGLAQQAGDALDAARMDWVAKKHIMGSSYGGVTSLNIIVHVDDYITGGARGAIDCMIERDGASMAASAKQGGV